MASLLLTVDVEEDSPDGQVQVNHPLQNLLGIPGFQALCDRLGLRPTYLLAYPAATRPEGEIFLAPHADKRCEIGALLQPWSCPPFDAGERRLEAVHPSRLPASVMAAKLARLTEALQARFGQRPTSYRAGRFGLNGAGLQALERLGYRIDSSVTPFRDWREQGGVDWRGAPEVPYFPDRQYPVKRGSSPVLEVPLSLGWDRRMPEPVGRMILKAPRWSRLVALLDNPIRPITKVTWLYPAAHGLEEMCQLAEVLVDRGIPALNVFLRSRELWPGTSPTTRGLDDQRPCLETLERFCSHVMNVLGAVPRTLDEFAHHYLNEAP